MKNKNKILYIILIFLIVIFTFVIVDKTFQNDTFDNIPIGKFIVENKCVDGLEHWSFHENIKFTYPRLDF